MSPLPDPSPQKSAPAATEEAAREPAAAGEYSQQERALLVLLVHQTIEATLRGEPLPAAAAPLLRLEPRGAFVTLHLEGQLRGCVGFVQAARGLSHTIAEAAVSAAFHDPRFPPVSLEEAPGLRVEISVLSPLQAIAPEEIVAGRHGLVVSRGPYRGLLLPQVAVEQEWDALTFLEQTCLKAGLPADAWKRGATVEAFTAEVFGEAE
jgi:AmmeMemoRadiSam system protein A